MRGWFLAAVVPILRSVSRSLEHLPSSDHHRRSRLHSLLNPSDIALCAGDVAPGLSRASVRGWWCQRRVAHGGEALGHRRTGSRSVRRCCDAWRVYGSVAEDIIIFSAKQAGMDLCPRSCKACEYVHRYLCIHMCIHAYIHMCRLMQVHANLYVCKHVYMRVCLHMCVHMHMYLKM